MRLFLLALTVMLAAALLLACSAPLSVNADELEMVNRFLAENRAEEIKPDAAGDMNEPSMINLETGEVVSAW